MTFGIKPTEASTAYGYLELGEPLGPGRRVDQFKEKPDSATAAQYLEAGPDRYLWNSGMFVWRAATLMDCISRYEAENYEGLAAVGRAWGTAEEVRTLKEIYPKLKKISVDYAVMEPASRDPRVRVVAIPMPLQWIDVGSWPAFARTCSRDTSNNALAAVRHLMLESSNTLLASSDDDHLIATIGCENLIVIHTPDATLVCRADNAEQIKQLHALVGKKFGEELL